MQLSLYDYYKRKKQILNNSNTVKKKSIYKSKWILISKVKSNYASKSTLVLAAISL
jgi:hypothetical protein